MQIPIRRYLPANRFLSELKKLKAYGSVDPSLLESLEEPGILRPRIRRLWPDPVARRFWLERKGRAKELHDPIEPDGRRLDAAKDLRNALSRHGFLQDINPCHPFDEPKPEWGEFLQTPDQQSFLPHKDRRIRVSSDARPDLHNSEHILDYYSSWQLLVAAEVSNMGIHIRVNMANDEISKRALSDIRDGRLPAGCASSPGPPDQAFRDFEVHEASLDAIEWSRVGTNNGTVRLLQGSGGERIFLDDEQIAAIDEVERTVGRKACSRFCVDRDALVECCRFLARRWLDWSYNGRPLVAGAYKIFLTEAVRLLQFQFQMSFGEINETVGCQRGGFQRTLEIVWPDWEKEQIDRLVRTLKDSSLSKEEAEAFGAFLMEKFQDAVFHRLTSFESHAVGSGASPIAGLQSDLQGMSLAVEQTVRALGGEGPQLSKMFLNLWSETEVGRILKQNRKLLEQKRTLLTPVQSTETLLDEINVLREFGGEYEKAADLILAARVRGSVHYELKIENQLELEKLFVRLLCAAAVTHAHIAALNQPGPGESS